MASGFRQASGIVFPAQLPARYLLRVEVGPCDMQWLEITVPLGNGMSTVQYDRLSSAHPHTFGIFVDPSAQPSVVSNTFANPDMLTCIAKPPAVSNNDAQIPGFINELNREVHQAPANNEPSILMDQYPTILGRPRPHTSGIVVASATVPFYAILAIPCKDIDEANEILAQPVYLGAAWQPPDDKPVTASHATKSTDTNANGSHSLIPHQDPPPEYHPSFPVGNLGPANR